MDLNRPILFVTFVLTFLNFSYAQQRFQIHDFQSNEPIPFVKVIPDVDAPLLTDIDGFFELKQAGNTKVLLKSVGYPDTTIMLDQAQNGVILYRARVLQLAELKASPGVNPAHRIMEQAIANRKKNNPTEDLAFTYDSYSKMIFAFDQTYRDTITPDMSDSSYRQLSYFMDSINLFQIESTSSRKFKPPARNKEIINSYKVSGFTDPLFSTFFNEMQSFHFYENQFSILGKVYISPLAFGGINRYLFILQDTTLNPSGDTTFTISFRPRKGKNFDGMRGQLFINTNGFAIEKVIASPALPDSSLNINIIQEYAFLHNQHWFPVKLSTEIEFNALSITFGKKYKPKVVGKGNSYLSNILFNPDLSWRDFDQISIETAPDAGDTSENKWKNQRKFELTEKEQNTYKVIGEASQENHFDRYLQAFKVLSTGKIPMGPVNLSIDKLYTYNEFEKHRPGLALETSDKLMKRVHIGAFGAWGSRDKVFKYGGHLDVNLHRRSNLFVKAAYSYDVFERGGHVFQVHKNQFDPSESIRRFYIKQMDYQQMAELSVRGYVVPRVQFQLFGSYQRISIGDDYRFTPSDSTVFRPEKTFDLAETGIELSWQFREEIMQIGYNRVSLGSKFPLVHLKVVRGISGIEKSAYDYWRMNLSVGQTIALRGAGKLRWDVRAGQTTGNVPLFLLHTMPASNGKNKVSVPGTFETMIPATVYSDRFVLCMLRYSLPGIKTPWPKIEPKFGVHHAFGFGSMKHPEYHSLAFSTMSRGFYEYGLVIDNLYKTGLSGLGIGIFNQYGYYAQPDFVKGLVYKLTLSLAF